MSSFERRVERDLREIGEHAPSSTDAWASIRDRIESRGDTTPEAIMLDTDHTSPTATKHRRVPILAGAAVLALLALVLVFSLGGGDDELDTVEDPTVPTTEPTESEDGAGDFPQSEVEGLSALVVDGTYLQMNQAACTLEETVSRGGTDLVKVLSEGKSVDDVRYSVLLTRSLDGDGDEFDKIRFVYVGDGSKFEEVQYTAEGEALFEVNDDLVQAVDVEARSPDGSDSITASFTFDC